MTTLVDCAWVEARLDSHEAFILDPRGRMAYLRGHVRGAINLPVTRLLGERSRLLGADEIADQLSAAGLNNNSAPVLYDSFDGQRGAMMAWVLEYLGRTDVHLMDTFFDGWVASGREVFYRPVEPTPANFTPSVDDQRRVSLDEVQHHGDAKLLDVRSVEEFSGQSEIDERPGHIPGAVNIEWRDFVGTDHGYLGPAEETERRLSSVGIEKSDRVVTYCRVGMRSAVGYLALQQLGYRVHMYDGSFAEWADAGLPVEA